MDYITFKQFVYTINIRDCHTSFSGKECEDNNIIRIYYGNDYSKSTYIDIGWYDYFNKDTVWNILENSLNKKILDSVVTDFRYNEDYLCFEVYLSSKKDLEETLEEYQN